VGKGVASDEEKNSGVEGVPDGEKKTSCEGEMRVLSENQERDSDPLGDDAEKKKTRQKRVRKKKKFCATGGNNSHWKLQR